MRLTQTVAPTTQPVTLEEAKVFLRIDHNEEDSLISDQIKAATDDVEAFTNRQLITATYTLTLPAYPAVIFLARPPLVAVSSIQYVDLNGDTQTESSSVYTVTSGGNLVATIQQAWGQSWSSTRSIPEAVTVTYTAGYGAAAAVPQAFKTAIKMSVTDMYEQRSTSSELRLMKNETANNLLWPFRVNLFS